MPSLLARLLLPLAAALLPAIAPAADLTPLELRWLRGLMPVLEHAREQRWPLDIVVQPQHAAGLAPLAMAWVDGRCKLVLSMRGNPEAQATLDRIEPALLGPTLEMIAAHELGHCSRHVAGRWHALPPGSPEALALHTPPGLSTELHADWRRMQAVRREEAHADLTALAWVQQRHGAHYAALRDWLVAERSRELIPRSHHDTLAWLRLARDGATFSGTTPWAAADAMWRRGVEAEQQQQP
jgi:hypothetical protein